MLVSHTDTIIIEAHRRTLIGEAVRTRAMERDTDRKTIEVLRARVWTGRLHRFTGLITRFAFRKEHAGLA